MVAQPPGVLGVRQAVHPVEVLGDGPGLVGLDAPDEVPLDGQVLKLRLLLHGLLDITLAEGPLAGGEGGAHGRRRLELAHRDQPHGRLRAACGTRGGAHALADQRQPCGDACVSHRRRRRSRLDGPGPSLGAAAFQELAQPAQGLAPMAEAVLDHRVQLRGAAPMGGDIEDGVVAEAVLPPGDSRMRPSQVPWQISGVGSAA